MQLIPELVLSFQFPRASRLSLLLFTYLLPYSLLTVLHTSQCLTILLNSYFNLLPFTHKSNGKSSNYNSLKENNKTQRKQKGSSKLTLAYDYHSLARRPSSSTYLTYSTNLAVTTSERYINWQVNRSSR